MVSQLHYSPNGVAQCTVLSGQLSIPTLHSNSQLGGCNYKFLYLDFPSTRFLGSSQHSLSQLPTVSSLACINTLALVPFTHMSLLCPVLLNSVFSLESFLSLGPAALERHAFHMPTDSFSQEVCLLQPVRVG